MNTSPAIYAAMSAILLDVKPILKDHENKHFKFKFRGIDDVMNALHPIFAMHKVFFTSEILKSEMTERKTSNGLTNHHMVHVRYTFHAVDGSTVSSEALGEAADTGDKGGGKAQSYALKVALLQTFLIPTEGDNDPDAHATTFTNAQTEFFDPNANGHLEALKEAFTDAFLDETPPKVVGKTKHEMIEFVWQAQTPFRHKDLVTAIGRFFSGRTNEPV